MPQPCPAGLAPRKGRASQNHVAHRHQCANDWADCQPFNPRSPASLLLPSVAKMRVGTSVPAALSVFRNTAPAALASCRERLTSQQSRCTSPGRWRSARGSSRGSAWPPSPCGARWCRTAEPRRAAHRKTRVRSGHTAWEDSRNRSTSSTRVTAQASQLPQSDHTSPQQPDESRNHPAPDCPDAHPQTQSLPNNKLADICRRQAPPWIARYIPSHAHHSGSTPP